MLSDGWGNVSLHRRGRGGQTLVTATMIWYCFRTFPLSFTPTLRTIFEGQSVLGSIASFYDIVGLHCCYSAKSFVKSSLVWFILDWRLMLWTKRWTRLQQTCIAATTPHLTHHALSLCHTTILTNAHTYTTHLLLPATGQQIEREF